MCCRVSLQLMVATDQQPQHLPNATLRPIGQTLAHAAGTPACQPPPSVLLPGGPPLLLVSGRALTRHGWKQKREGTCMQPTATRLLKKLPSSSLKSTAMRFVAAVSCDGAVSGVLLWASDSHTFIIVVEWDKLWRPQRLG